METVNLLRYFLYMMTLSQYVDQVSTRDLEVMSPYSKEGDLEDNETLAMILSQSAVCPYVRLCTFGNMTTSAFVVKMTHQYKCCSDCSCNISCLEHGNCCPDFVNERFYSNSTQAAKPVQANKIQTTDDLDCVRTHHGNNNINNNGYKMVARCASNFTDLNITRRCEGTVDIPDYSSLHDVIPIFDRRTDTSYKNIYCFLCQKAENYKADVSFQSLTSWDIQGHCFLEMHPSLYVRFEPLSFVKFLIYNRCNVVFTNSYGIYNDTNKCEFKNFIKTCKGNYVGTKLEKLCTKYMWPIAMRQLNKIKFYQNYACLLCNDRNFIENCVKYSSENSKVTFFLTKPDELTVAKISGNKADDDNDMRDVITGNIDKYFPNNRGEVLCNKGFIFDENENSCRKVFCPVFFFLQHGICVPMFHTSKGLFYYHLFGVDFSASFDGHDTENIEIELLTEINQSLSYRSGAGSYHLSLWGNENFRGEMNRSRKYFVLIILWDEHVNTSYLEILKLLKTLRGFHQMELSVLKEKSTKKVLMNLELYFTTEFQVSKSVSVSGQQLYLRQPKNFSLSDFFEREKSLEVKISHLCYRLSLNISELESASMRQSVMVKRTRQLLSIPNFQRYITEKEFFIFVCLEHALNNVAKENKYIFDSIPLEQTSVTGSNVAKESTFVSAATPQNAVEQMNRSVIAIICTAIVLLFAIGGRLLLKRLTKLRMIN